VYKSYKKGINIMSEKFNPNNLEKLNNPERLNLIDLRELLKILDLNDCPKIADVGAGTGLFSRAFLEKIPNCTLYALDISDKFLNYMDINLQDYYGDRLKIGKMQETHIPLKDNSIDLIVMINLHHELLSPKELLKDAYRVLKEEGKIFIADWKEGMHKEALSKDSIISDMKEAAFSPIEEVLLSNELLCLIGER
ncbi:class I SAM-dependent methyltransferase, partial [Clostridium perfringens]|nr:class I SAM-dependent methyltransferase [Clostridium perfringens]